MNKICLSMIVKNEAKVIVRCLDSVARFIHRWCIVDTGSTDGTQGIIREHMSKLGIPGELFERPWVDFGRNRSDALTLARINFGGKCRHILVIDADEVLELVPPFTDLPELANWEVYNIETKLGDLSYERPQIFSIEPPFRYVGVRHEYLELDEPFRQMKLQQVINRPKADGARSSDPDKYASDATALELERQRDPKNTRTVFYLAQSYRDAGFYDQAAAMYELRASMGGWDEEVYQSLYEAGRAHETSGHSSGEVVRSYLAAYNARPTRAEPLCALARFYRGRHMWAPAFLFAQQAKKLPRPADRLFVDDSVYDWRARDEFAIAAFYVGRFAESRTASARLLGNKALPTAEYCRVRENHRLAKEALHGC